jgi:hypothetical protein
MKSKTWHAVANTAKHFSHHQQQPLVYQHSFTSLSSIRPHLPTSAVANNTDSPSSTNTNTPIIATSAENSIYDYNYTNRKKTSTYYPIYQQPSTTSSRRSLSTSISLSSTATNALSQAALASPGYDISPQQEHFPPSLHHTKSLPLLDFFSKSYAKPVPSYIFAHGASGFAKRRNRYTTPDNMMNKLTSVDNEHYCSIQIGEDAYFRRSDALGVADGVGGWADVSGNSKKSKKFPFLKY